MKQSTSIGVVVVVILGLFITVLLVTNYAGNSNQVLTNQQTNPSQNTEETTGTQKIAVNETTELDTYDMTPDGYVLTYPKGWNIRFDTNDNRLIIDPPGEGNNPYSQDQGEYTNPIDDIIIRTISIPSLEQFFDTTLVPGPEGQPKKLVVQGHTVYQYVAPGLMSVYTYLIEMTNEKYLELSTSGEEANLDLIFQYLNLVTPDTTINPNTASTKSFPVLDQGYTINYPKSFHIRYSGDPEAPSVTIDPPGEGPNPYGSEVTEWTNPTDDILIRKITIPDLDQYILDNMIDKDQMKPILIDNRNAWHIVMGAKESITYGYLVKINETTYLELTSVAGGKNLVDIAQGIKFWSK